MNITSPTTLRSLYLPAWIILLIAALNGLIYVFLVPPWEHNDEPGNFEYAWMFANMEGKREDWMWQSDQQMRREVAASMIEQGFFERHPVGRPNLLLIEQEIWIGLKQTAGLPLYFWLASLPLRLLKYLDITLQLYAARLVSWTLFCFTVYLSVLVNRELNWETKWGAHLPLLFALFPSFVDKMTAVNDDVAAVAFFTLFLYWCICIGKRGISVLNLVALLVSIALCLGTKRNVWVSAPLGIMLLLWVGFRRWKVVRWALFGTLLVIIPSLLLSINRRTPAFFYAFANQQLAGAIKSEKAVAGEWVAHLSSGYRLMYQPIPEEQLIESFARRLELGYWIWGEGDEGELRTLPVRVLINGENKILDTPIHISSRPSWVHQKFELPDAIHKIAVEVSVTVPENAEIYLDCLYLIIGDTDQLITPKAVDPTCSVIEKDQTRRMNLIRNGSFEQTWIRLQPWFERWVDEKFAFSITHLWAVMDVNVGLAYLRLTGMHIFETFWGRFGWGAVPLKGENPYLVFTVITLILLIGNLLSIVRSKGKIGWGLLIFLCVSAVSVLIMTLFRGGGNWIWYEATPNARYLMPAFLPLGVLIVNGWSELSNLLLRSYKGKPNLTNYLWFGFLIVYNVWSMVSIWSYYAGVRSLS